MGEKETDPVLVINDLLPHLGAKQRESWQKIHRWGTDGSFDRQPSRGRRRGCGDTENQESSERKI